MDSVVKVYALKKHAINALNYNLPMSAILAHDGTVHSPFHPVGREGATRSSVSLLELKFLDSEGSYVHSMCWMVPLQVTEHTTEFATIFQLQSEFAKEFILLLPKLHDDGNNFTNYYYCIGHRWTEQGKDGVFAPSPLVKEVFVDWEEEMEDDEEDKLKVIAQTFSVDSDDEYDDRIPSTTPGAEPPRDVRDSGSARSHSTHLETSSSDRP